MVDHAGEATRERNLGPRTEGGGGLLGNLDGPAAQGVAHLGQIGAYGQRQFDHVRNHIGGLPAMDRADRDHAHLPIGSTLPCGSAPWPPLPITFSRAQSTDAIAGPSTKPKWPTGTPGQLCSP
ncbi:hypothetical protein G6F32_014569 [Rhizopus arrhizus]|nr:hypothetical protein G6F32_014569 [Rhizopus arrhizus]